jgi:hypothetical protein
VRPQNERPLPICASGGGGGGGGGGGKEGGGGGGGWRGRSPRHSHKWDAPGEQRGEQKLVLILLTQKFGELAPSLQEQIRQLSTPLPPVANHKALTLVLTLVD